MAGRQSLIFSDRMESHNYDTTYIEEREDSDSSQERRKKSSDGLGFPSPLHDDFVQPRASESSDNPFGPISAPPTLPSPPTSTFDLPPLRESDVPKRSSMLAVDPIPPPARNGGAASDGSRQRRRSHKVKSRKERKHRHQRSYTQPQVPVPASMDPREPFAAQQQTQEQQRQAIVATTSSGSLLDFDANDAALSTNGSKKQTQPAPSDNPFDDFLGVLDTQGDAAPDDNPFAALPDPFSTFDADPFGDAPSSGATSTQPTTSPGWPPQQQPQAQQSQPLQSYQAGAVSPQKQYRSRQSRQMPPRQGSGDRNPFASASSSASAGGESSDEDGNSSSDMSEGEFHRRQQQFQDMSQMPPTAPPSALPPPRHSAKHQRPVRGHKSRASAPAGTLAGATTGDFLFGDQEPVLKERRVGVDVKKAGTSSKVKSNIAKTQAARQARSQSPIQSPGRTKTRKPAGKAPQPPEKKFDVLPELKRGTALLKYGRRGYPHFRQFNISEDNRRLIWFSNKKKLSNSSIDVASIDDVVQGQHTKEFRRIAWTTLTPASFTVHYDRRRRSLNLVAKSVDEMKMWVTALRILRERARKGEDLSKLRELKIGIDFRDRNRPMSRQHSGHFLRGHETKEREVDSALHRKLIADMEGLRKLFREVQVLSENDTIRGHTEEGSIRQILSELEERIEELEQEVIHTRNTKIAENDVWRTRIDLESLKDKIKVITKQCKGKKGDKTRRWSVF